MNSFNRHVSRYNCVIRQGEHSAIVAVSNDNPTMNRCCIKYLANPIEDFVLSHLFTFFRLYPTYGR
jgi:hypothetical protein